MLLFVILLLAHEWCPPACCGDGNCRPIPCEDIVYKKGGETGYTTACYDGFTFYQWNWMESKDSGCHAPCLLSARQYGLQARKMPLPAEGDVMKLTRHSGLPSC
jgi:hypothetical protein